MRAVATQHLAEHGVSGMSLQRVALAAGVKFNLARYYYGTIKGLFADVVRVHQTAMGEAVTEAVLEARQLCGVARLTALAAGYFEALMTHRDGHRAAVAVIAAVPDVTEVLRRGDLWLFGEFAAAVEAAVPGLGARGVERDILARSLLLLLDGWAVRVDGADAEMCAACAALGVRMVVGAG